MKSNNRDPAAIYAAQNSVRLHPAQVKLIQVSKLVVLLVTRFIYIICSAVVTLQYPTAEQQDMAKDVSLLLVQ